MLPAIIYQNNLRNSSLIILLMTLDKIVTEDFIFNKAFRISYDNWYYSVDRVWAIKI